MGKTALCIRMLQLLNSGKTYKISELASLLETNPRNIIEYRNELEEAGYIIISMPGKYGGYKLDEASVIPSLRFTEGEKKALFEGASYLEARNDFLFKEDFSLAMAKVNSSMRHEQKQPEMTIFEKFPLLMGEEELRERYYTLQDAIERHCVVEMEYTALDNVLQKRNIEPYKVYSYNNAWYLLAFDETENDFRYYKLNRFHVLHITNRKFHIRHSYIESNYLDEFGMKQNGKWYPIALKISGMYAVLAHERLFGKNQKIEQIDDKTILLTCEMQNKDRILCLALGFGKLCEVISPDWLKEELADAGEYLSKYRQ